MSLFTLLGGALVLIGVSAAAWGAARRGERRVRDLRQVLELSYLDDGTKLSPQEASSLLARTGALAERALQGTSLIGRLRSVIDRSDYAVSPGELVALSLGIAAGGALLGWLAGSPLLVLVLVPVGLVAPYAAVSRSVSVRRKRFESQFPDILDLVAASLESGASVQQAFELVVAESDEPAASEFARVLTATRFGTPLVEALETMAERLGSRDLAWTVQAILVQQKTGGRLAEVLRIVAGVMRAREEIRREIDALTAEGRLSAYILTALPLVFVAFLALVRPAYLRPLYTSALGLVMLVGATVAVAAAYVAMRRIVKIEV